VTGRHSGPAGQRGIPQELLNATTTSLRTLLTDVAPDLLPTAVHAGVRAGEGTGMHGTTVLALTFPGGVVAAGDRRGTMGNLIGSRRLRKVYPVDEHTVVGFAGSVGIGINSIRLFQMELEHYEKLEGVTLSFGAKTNRLAAMLRESLGLAMQGLSWIPLLAGYEAGDERGRVVTYDIAGSVDESDDYDSIGSGSFFAKAALKKLYRPDFTADQAVRAALEALYDAADEDSATVGPDRSRKIYPTVSVVSAEGIAAWTEEQVAVVADQVVAGRHDRPGGPAAI
jgi:proteasome beta subunit